MKNAVEPLSLYDLAADVGETRNLASQHPDKLRELEAAWQGWNAEMQAPLWECDARGRLPSREAPLPPGVLFTHQTSVVLENGQLVIESTGHDPQVGFDAVPLHYVRAAITAHFPLGLVSPISHGYALVRGENQISYPLAVADGKLTLTLAAYAPASFILQDQ